MVFISIINLILSFIPLLQPASYGIVYFIVLVIGIIFICITSCTDKSNIADPKQSNLFRNYLIALVPLWLAYFVGVIFFLASTSKYEHDWLLWFRMIVAHVTLWTYLGLVWICHGVWGEIF